MSYLLGERVPLHFELTVNDVDSDAGQLTVLIVKPDGLNTTITADHDGTGIYDLEGPADQPGRYTWVATASTGDVTVAVSSGLYDVTDPTSTTPGLVDVAPWTDATAIRQRPGCAGIDQRLLTDAALAATGILYALSGRQFSGRIITTVRPAAARLGDRRPAGMWFNTWGVCGYAYAAGYGASWLSAWYGHTCNARPPRVELGGYPVTDIIAVKIDGETIPADEYTVYDHRLLVRALPTATSQPTARAGWPTCQRLDLPDTEPGTFSVEFGYGTPPPAAGVLAVNSLAAELALAFTPGASDTRLPERVKTIVRQGESVTLVDAQDVLDQGRTGIPEVDLFIKAYNGAGLQGRSSAWSPDMGSSRRPT